MTIALQVSSGSTLLTVLRQHWKLYLIEASLLGMFMISACAFGVLLEHPELPLRRSIESGLVRRMLMGLAMAGTAMTLIYTRWGRRSGAHMNPATTLAFLWLGRIHPVDAAGYIAGQFIGGVAGVSLVVLTMSEQVRHPSVNYVSTLPGMYGLVAAWTAEFVIAFLMLTMVLNVNRFPRLAPYTGCFAGLLVGLYITFEAPVSGMSLNPARSFASAVHAGSFDFLWIYFTAPVAGMIAGVEMNRRMRGSAKRMCGKFSHSRAVQCIFKCSCVDAVASGSTMPESGSSREHEGAP
jgi:aquaporin Z